MSQVQLAVYDLTRGMARTMSQAILGQRIDGIWHTGIVVFGYEYYFGGGIQKTAWGVFAQSNQLPPVQVLEMGNTTKTMQEFEAYLSTIQSRFTMMTYDLIHNNCNNFADTICQFLVGNGIPNHIVDLPRIVFSTPGGAMLRPMIENMQANIRQQNGQGLDPFGGSAANNGRQFEQQLSESVTSLVMNIMLQNGEEAASTQGLQRANLDEKPLLSMDSGTIQAMEKMLHNLAGPDGIKGSALTEEEHNLLTAVVQKLLATGQSVQSLTSKELSNAEANKSFSIDEYLFFEKLLAVHPKAQSASLFILRLMLLHDRTSDYSDISIIRELIRRLLGKPKQQSDCETSTGFASVPAHVMALCAISNLLSHERGLSTLYKLPISPESMEEDTNNIIADADDNVLNDLVDVVLSGLANERAEVRQMSTTLAYNLTLACTKDYLPSGPWKTSTEESDSSSLELNAHALQLLCGCFEGILTEKDAMVRKRRLSIACRISRTFAVAAGSLMSDLGFADTLQILKSDNSILPAVSSDEKAIIGELLHYCSQ